MENYKNKGLSIEERVEDLLLQMTLKEKVGQLNQKIFGWDAYKKIENTYEVTDAFKGEVEIGDGLGALYGLFRADPWSKITFENGIPLKYNAKVANMLQKYVIENTRLGIPILISEECPHGHQALDGTMFPTNIGIGSTWNPKLYQKAFSQVAAEIRSRGGNLGLISCLDILQDPRWGRSEECYSEDPYLASKMTEAVTIGLQGSSKEDLNCHNKVVAVLKHLCAQGASIGGHNGKGVSLGEREIREIHLPAVKAGIEAGAMGCMAAYNEIDGVYCHGNKKLLTKILRDEWGFDGIVMSDGCGIDNLCKVTGDEESAAAMALIAGVDLNLWSNAYTKLEYTVNSGKVSEKFIDRAVRRILRLKFMLGIFDNAYTDETLALGIVGNENSRIINLNIARESVVLLKNNNKILPLKKDLTRIAVIGPNADSLYNQLGDYTAIQRDGTGISVLKGIKELVGANTIVRYTKGCGTRDESKDGFKEAIENAKKANVAILVLGGNSTRDFNVKFDTNGAAIVSDNLSKMDCGEGIDVADLELGGVQVDLVKAIVATGTPVAVVLIQGRPHAVPWIAEHCDAILCGWYPGKEGGRAIGEILFGNVNPSGKLSVSIPKSSAQLPVYYNHKDISDYIDMTSTPLYAFGFGLSYTTFQLSNFKIHNPEISVDDLEKNQTVIISIEVTNKGKIAGAEVIQLYIKDMEASISRRVKELKAFEKIWLKVGERKVITLKIGKEELSVWNVDMKFVIEPGNVKIMIGNSSITSQEKMLKITPSC